jgi:hypothetical protein
VTREEAIELRKRQLQGARVDPIKLQQAIETIRETEVYYSEVEVQDMRRRLGIRKTEEKPRVQVGAENMKLPALEADDAAGLSIQGVVDMDAIYENRSDRAE